MIDDDVEQVSLGLVAKADGSQPANKRRSREQYIAQGTN